MSTPHTDGDLLPTESSEASQVALLTLSVLSDSLPEGKALTVDPAAVDLSQPVIIKEGVEYQIAITFRVDHGIASGLRYAHVVKRAGLRIDKVDQPLGSYGPLPDPYTKRLGVEEAPSGLMARAGSYVVSSRISGDDGTVHADFKWSYKLATEW
ncbi:rho GDP-dissociation inhibitor [Streptomyces albipurpureus]|uniref:Rho GDP-dissociation inhibitor n=1 Tax=Streptomyces albipurpureus TaxID=2897419 RepID=A0ABT0UPH8_9ACTN|nr:rho GDP-dissociation inhibitor [Streptomyces sp. CWNU-1]MCM2389258.1 rho GDP-dissociation inhibitor [Streptomyces sp. CWNU-1]